MSQSPAIIHAFSERRDCVQALSAELAAQLQAALSAKPRAKMLLPGGSSPQLLLPLLAEAALDWSRVDLSATDERWVPAADPASNLRLLQQGLPAAVCLDPRQEASPELAVQAWGAQLCTWLPLDLVLLGMGEDGHFASLFPQMPGVAAALDPDCEPAALLAQAPSEPRVRLSTNLALLASSQWLGLLVFGAVKREMLEAVLADMPASRAWPVHALIWRTTQRVQIFSAP
ncbi:MAG: 6-phosphogluconolactonase [Pseudomonas sp.]|uniref:6-phosphogluconolactonase n=1 Tax=Pseudomonas sp. TaxID=306 RepID=UPI0027362700|nr:6-phosphogluconolactonase [Pseudomonas sp.]MDP3844873.1 6-phosphogluconolactonase [Pseudomonas sp.]